MNYVNVVEECARLPGSIITLERPSVARGSYDVTKGLRWIAFSYESVTHNHKWLLYQDNC